jgi:hypothetical protein
VVNVELLSAAVEALDREAMLLAAQTPQISNYYCLTAHAVRRTCRLMLPTHAHPVRPVALSMPSPTRPGVCVAGF